MVQLRPYQQKAIECVYKSWETNRKVLCEMATGLGKSFTMSAIANIEHNANNNRTLILSHRQELITQTS